ncbi:MAG: outer membrane protein assembly factor BamD [Phycisphaerae bacterium]|nr:outer membrane protein assembly factor BamD [Phycisphaerae bacterium]
MRNIRNNLWFAAAAVLLALLVADVRGQEQLVWNGTEWVSPKPAQPGTPEGDLVVLRQMVADGQNKRVVKNVEEFLVNHGESPACEEAMNLAGQALIHRGQYWEAYKWYERQISTYPNGAFFQRALDREFHIANAFVEGRKRKALKIFRVPADEDGLDMLTRIAAHAPGTPIAERSLLRVADHHFSKTQYPQAVACYEDFLKNSPLSEHRKYVMLQIARSYLLSYRGIKWDSTPLLDARKRYQLFAQAYPRDAEKENVEGILEEIRLGLAQKVYSTGRFYERTKYPRAAAYYYRKTIADYPDTHWANSARGRLDMLGPLPTDALPYTPPPPPTEAQAKSEDKTRPPVPTAQTRIPTGPPAADLPVETDTNEPIPPESPPEDPASEPVPLEELSKTPSAR